MDPRRTIYLLTGIAVAFSVGHHIDHLIRGNAVGWPVSGEVNAFTMSLGIYPLLATGMLLYRARRVGPGFWALMSSGGAAFVGLLHFGPLAVEPPRLVHGGHDSVIAGWLAFGWLVAFIGVLIVTSIVETRAWYAARHSHREPERLAVGGID
jgi:hypothetical protein